MFSESKTKGEVYRPAVKQCSVLPWNVQLFGQQNKKEETARLTNMESCYTKQYSYLGWPSNSISKQGDVNIRCMPYLVLTCGLKFRSLSIQLLIVFMPVVTALR